MIQIVPTLFATSEEAYLKRIEKLNACESLIDSWVQIDLMDNKFVQNQSVDTNVVKKYSLDRQTEIQLMVEDPLSWMQNLTDFKLDRVIFPIEIGHDIDELIKFAKENNWQVGLSINPETDIQKIEKYQDKIDAVLLMSVTPGLEGQKFNPVVLDKIRYTKDSDWKVLVGVDGGINDTNVGDLVKSGADYLAIGSFLFKGSLDENIEKIWETIKA